ncbi:hypothetical protein [Microbulbifer sp. M83]|uniref:hypothetical protein n=1 Tax=Microbulbifer sp. M83 TaxID=3118246 RepID=UPI002FE22971
MESTTEILDDSSWLPVDYDAETDEFHFAQVSIDHIETMPFHDGRHPLAATNDLVAITAERLRGWRSEPAPGEVTGTLIIHSGFCGSTLLSRVLSVPGKSFVLREPRAITRLSNACLPGLVDPAHLSETQKLFDRTVARLCFSMAPYARPAIKLSNWDNILLATGGAENGNYRILSMTCDLRAYIVAIFRGGKPRIRQTLELLERLRQVGSVPPSLVSEAQSYPGSMTSICCLLACAYAAQATAMSSVAGGTGATETAPLTLESLRADPVESLSRANRQLELGLSTLELAQAWESIAPKHAKDPQGQEFSLDREIQFARELVNEWGDAIEAAVMWAQQRGIPASPSVTAGS